MNSKFIVPFETAKQLKAKGYPQWDTDYVYEISTGDRYIRVMVEENEDVILAAPTYHEVLDWLESKGILIDCTCGYHYNDIKAQWYRCFTIQCGMRVQDWHTSQCPSREEALNAAILKALELI